MEALQLENQQLKEQNKQQKEEIKLIKCQI